MKNKRQKIIIAIDGYSSTGKSTIAKRLAGALGYVYVDTGAMYRAVTLFAMNEGLAENNKETRQKLIKRLSEVHLEFKFNETLGYAEMFLNGENVEKEIRTMDVSKKVSAISAIPEVRKKLVQMQKKMGQKKGLVMDGRDIGTVVFPEAEMKLFLTASPAKRARRRYKELLDRGDVVSYEEVLKNVEYRDYIDSHREDSPLKIAEDAIELDNTDMGLDEQFERVLGYANRLIEQYKNH